MSPIGRQNELHEGTSIFLEETMAYCDKLNDTHGNKVNNTGPNGNPERKERNKSLKFQNEISKQHGGSVFQ